MTAARLPENLHSISYINECLLFDAESGVFTWKRRPRSHFKTESGHAKSTNRFAGANAGWVNHQGYVRISIDGVAYNAHRLAWAMHTGCWPKEEIDHIDLNRSNNRISNLREVDRVTNLQRCSIRKDNTSKVTGVHYRKDRNVWQAKITVSGRVIYLGNHKTFDAAVAARQAANILYGFSDNHGTKQPTTIPVALPGRVCSSNTSGVTGCSWSVKAQKWQVSLKVQGVTMWLGSYDSLERAAEVRQAAEERYGVAKRKGCGRVKSY